MSEYQVKDSGERQSYTTGARRDTSKGKPRLDLISPHALNRLGIHLAKGAEKYAARNWEKGIPTSRFYASALRHLLAWGMGKRDEDHLSAVLFNVMGIIHFEEKGGNPADNPTDDPEIPHPPVPQKTRTPVIMRKGNRWDIHTDPEARNGSYWYDPAGWYRFESCTDRGWGTFATREDAEKFLKDAPPPPADALWGDAQ